jgi:hypothetical protein
MEKRHSILQDLYSGFVLIGPLLEFCCDHIRENRKQAKEIVKARPEGPSRTAIDCYALKPTNDQLAELKQLRAEMPEVNSNIKQLIEEDLPRTNQLMIEAGDPFLSISGQFASRGQRRRQE